MPGFKEKGPSQEPITTPHSFQQLFDDCLVTGEDPVVYAKNNNININSEDFFSQLREWSKATAGKRDYKEDLLLYKATENSKGCCHIDCGGPTCSRAMLEKILREPHPLAEQKLELLAEVVKSKSFFIFSKPSVIEKLLAELFNDALSQEELTRVSQELISIKKLIEENRNYPNPHVVRDLEKLESNLGQYEKMLNERQKTI